MQEDSIFEHTASTTSGPLAMSVRVLSKLEAYPAR